MKKDKSLSEQQMDIMRILWRLGEASVADVHNALQPSRPLAPTTVATMLSRLEKRGLLDHRTENRQYIYFPTVSEKEVRRSMVSDLVHRLFKGDIRAMVNHLVRENEMSADELADIHQLISDKAKNEEEQ